MDWTMFLFGVVVGVLTFGVTSGIIVWRWVAPFVQAAQERTVGRTASGLTPDSTGNDPAKDWLASFKSKGGDR